MCATADETLMKISQQVNRALPEGGYLLHEYSLRGSASLPIPEDHPRRWERLFPIDESSTPSVRYPDSKVDVEGVVVSKPSESSCGG